MMQLIRIVFPFVKNTRVHFIPLLLFSFILLALESNAARLTGRITDRKGDALPFASVMVSGTSHGTTANPEGLYSLELSPGTYRIAFSMIGYHQRLDTITIRDTAIGWNVVLENESYQLNELSIVAGEDPAYSIIRHAQEKRPYYQREEVVRYSCESYIKSTQRLSKFPKKFMGQKLEIDDLVDTASGIFYLSESVSKIDVLKPADIKEEMISSKVSGNPRSYSFNSASDLLGISVYEPLLKFAGLAPRGIISPLDANSFFYYKFVLEGAFMEGGQLINKIKVIPKRLSDPVFTGDIYIVDGSWRVHSLDLFITKAQQLQFVDTFRIRQSDVPVENDVWMPFSTTIYFHFNLLGFEGAGEILGVFKEYDLHPDFSSRDFKGEQLKVDGSANKRDAVYWEKVRPVPLTGDENTDYHRRDSTQRVKNSAVYLDSVDHVNNRFGAGALITGYTHRNSAKNRSWSVSSPIQHVQFNTVEGFNVTLSANYTQQFGDTDAREWSIEPELRYGFSNTHFCPSFNARYRYDAHKPSTLELSGGRTVNQFNANDPISPSVNSEYSLLARKNYMKIYQQDFFGINHRSEVVNGISLGLNLFFANRTPLNNTSDYSFVRSDRPYTSNDPVGFGGEVIRFQAHSTLVISVNTRIRFDQKYISRPEGKYILGSRYPTLRVEYQKGIPIDLRFTDYQFIRTTVEDEVGTGLLGTFSYKIGAGRFLSSKRIEFMDYKHFNGNQTWFSSFRLQDFPGLDYYSFSTTLPYFEGHAEQHFQGFLFNKVPGLRKLKLDEVVSVHGLVVQDRRGIIEVAAGLEKLNLFRIQVFSSLREGKWTSPGIVLGIKKVLGSR